MRKTPRERESASESWENGTNLRYVKYVTSFIVLSELKTIFACTGSVKRDGKGSSRGSGRKELVSQIYGADSVAHFHQKHS